MKAKIILLAATLAAAISAPAMAADRNSAAPEDFFGFVQPQAQPVSHAHYCNGNVTCEERHMGYNVHSDSIHPDIGAQTDN